MTKSKFPKTLSWMFLTGFTFLLVITFFRFIFFFHFRPLGYSFSENFDAFLLGLNFDLRITCLIILPPFLLGNVNLKFRKHRKVTLGDVAQVGIILLIMASFAAIMKRIIMDPTIYHLYIMILFFVIILFGIFYFKNCNPFENPVVKKIFMFYFIFVSGLVVLIYSVDFQYYGYLHQRLNATIFNYSKDLGTSMSMVWASYPVILMLIILVLISLFLYLTINYYYKKISKLSYRGSQFFKVSIIGIFGVLLGVGLFGRINIFPLRFNDALKWSDAFSFHDEFKGNLALNPVQSLLSTLQVKSATYDLKKVKEFYSLVANDLGVKNLDSLNLNYNRTFTPTKDSIAPNIILVLCESFAGYKSSMWGNPLNTTPFFNQLCKEGIFFDRCFTPGYGTTRGIWATITGIPDVDLPNMATQNPTYTNQSSIINSYKGYEKFYFVGGNAGFENIGPLLNNINGMKIYEEKDYKAKRISMWGISDKRLFMEANDVLKVQSNPFFAIIQTSGNHMPYTIAEEDLGEFKLQNFPADTLKKYGFGSNEELNAFRYLDFSFEKFMELAEKQKYFNNTIFVFVGDHGNGGTPPEPFPKSWMLDWLTYNHVPLLFYAPAYLQPERIHRTVSQLDVLPSVSALAKVPYINGTFGRNLFDTTTKATRFKDARFLFNYLENAIGMVTDRYVYTRKLEGGKEDFRSSKDDLPLQQSPSVDEDRKELRLMAEAYYETAKYMLSHNKRKN